MGIIGTIVMLVVITTLSGSFDTDYHYERNFDTDYHYERNQREVRTVCHVVTEGETLWSIGERYYDGRKPLNEWMSDLRKANGFDVGSGRKYLYPGEIILVRTALPKEGEK